MVIWKWTLSPGETTLQMPEGAQILTVQEQGGEAQIWALCDPKNPKINRRFHVYGTGHNMPAEPGRYIATFQMEGGALVFHAFEANKFH